MVQKINSLHQIAEPTASVDINHLVSPNRGVNVSDFVDWINEIKLKVGTMGSNSVYFSMSDGKYFDRLKSRSSNLHP